MALTEQEELELLELEKEKASSVETPPTQSFNQPSAQQTIEPQNIIQSILNVPSAAIRSFIQGTGYQQGALQPSKVPTFTSLGENMATNAGMGALNSPLAKAAFMATPGVSANPMAMAGELADTVTNPADMLMALIGLPQAGRTVSIADKAVAPALNSLKKIVKYDGALKQAEGAKVALDTLRDTLGKAKELALNDVKDIPVALNWEGNVSKKVVQAIQDPIYGIEFSPEGGVVGNIGNLDKVKTALRDLVTKKDFVEAGNMEKRQIMQFAGRVRDDMVKAANKAGRPELAKSLNDYHKFMDNYNLVNDHLVDKYGNAMGNKLKETFKIFAEPAVKQSWKEVAKASPQLKEIMGSMEHRELVKNLLKVTGVSTAVGLGGKGAIDLVTGR